MKSELIKEVWKPVPGYEQLYTASNFGRVMSLNRHYILKFYKDWCGYLRVTLSKNGKAKHFKVHRLVYETFIGAIPEGMQVNHINELKTDNSVWNLNLMTPKENTNYGTGIKRRAEKHKGYKPSQYIVERLSQPIYQCDMNWKPIKKWPSAQEAGRNGFSQGDIWLCLKGLRQSHHGFKWKYA